MKRLVLALAVLFVGFWLVQAPDDLAGFAKDGGGWLWDLTSTVFESAISFLGALVE